MERDRKAFADLKFNHQFENELVLSARFYFDHYRFDSFLPYAYNYEDPPVPGIRTVNRDLNSAQSYGTEVQLSRTFFEKHHVTWGGEFRWDTPLEMSNHRRRPRRDLAEDQRGARSRRDLPARRIPDPGQFDP
jgi:outer membrane receptor for ferrienterochelin and colicins